MKELQPVGELIGNIAISIYVFFGAILLLGILVLPALLHRY